MRLSFIIIGWLLCSQAAHSDIESIGNTPLHDWAQGKLDDILGPPLMLHQGYSINTQNKRGQTPIMLAIKAGNQNRCFIMLGYSIYFRPFDPTVQDNNQQTAMDYAQEAAMKPVVEFMQKLLLINTPESKIENVSLSEEKMMESQPHDENANNRPNCCALL
jgi:ankyrin repeat protein